MSQVMVDRPSGVPDLQEEPVPHRLAGAITRGPLVEATLDAVLLRVPNVGRFLVRAEGPTLVERASGATDADLGCFRDEPVAAAAALLRGELVLRGASVCLDGGVVVLCGPSGSGKSALAAGLAQRGHAVLADAVTVISGTEVPGVGPLAPDPVLWPDTVKKLGLEDEPARRVRPALAKCAYRLGPEPVASPIAAVAVLREDVTLSEPTLEPVTGGTKLQVLLAARWHRRLIDPLGRAAAQFPLLVRTAAAVDCVRLARPSQGVPVPVLAELLEELVA